MYYQSPATSSLIQLLLVMLSITTAHANSLIHESLTSNNMSVYSITDSLYQEVDEQAKEQHASMIAEKKERKLAYQQSM